MDRKAQSLHKMLRCELTAVNQQFTHILALRAWGEKDIAARIAEVDDVDFPNAMRILATLVETGAPLDLASASYVPGRTVTGILCAEQAMERRLAAVLAEVQVTAPRARALVATAQEPRAAYAEWLAERLSECNTDDGDSARPDAAAADLFAQLITMTEQSMAHAFVHRHAGDVEGADAAWATSGAAMMHLTALVRLFAARQDVPAPGAFPALRIARRPEMAEEADKTLAALVAQHAVRAARQTDEAPLAKLCRRIADETAAQARWVPGEEHPARRTNPPAFASFEATLKKFDIARPPAT